MIANANIRPGLSFAQNLVRALGAVGNIHGTERDQDQKMVCSCAIASMREELRENAPAMWEVDVDLSAILQGRAAWCPLPREFSAVPGLARFVGLPLLFDVEATPPLSLACEPLDAQVLRDALLAIGGAKMPPILYFGPYNEAGHYLCGPGGNHLPRGAAARLGFPTSGQNFYHELALSESIDGNYCPGYIKGAKQYDRRTRPEVEGEARLTHENGMTILGIWDRSVDKRGACNSTYIALGTYSFESMCKLCEAVYGERWRRLSDRIPIRLVERG